MMTYRTLVDVVSRSPDQAAGIGTLGLDGAIRRLSYNAFFQQAQRLLYVLQAQGLRPGDELVLQLDESQAFLRAFWACILGKIIAVPLHTATTEMSARKLCHVWSKLKHPRLIANSRYVGRLRDLGVEDAVRVELDRIVNSLIEDPPEGFPEDASLGEIAEAAPSDTAFVQFSSGSTGAPKGVVLTHRNLLTNIDAICRTVRLHEPGQSVVSWVPLTHDMGLVGLHLTPLVAGVRQFLIPTPVFVRRPTVWLRTLCSEQATTTGSPNFGFSHLLSYGRLDTMEGVDLSSVRCIVNGAEPISSSLCAEFMERMAAFRLPQTAMFPAYGMAEASLMVTGVELNSEVSVVEVSRRNTRVGHPVMPPADKDDALTLVDLGRVIPHVSLRVVDDNDNPLPDGFVGRIQIRGRSVASGYYGDQASTDAAFTEDGWHRTGDAGFLQRERLVVTGRLKDVVFVNGQNYYAHDLEEVIARQLEVDPRGIALCSIPAKDGGAEEVHVFVRFRGSLDKFVPLANAIRRVVPKLVGCSIDQVVPISKVPLTTSGKKQRFRLREAFIAAEFDNLIESLAEHTARARVAERPSTTEQAWHSKLEARVAEVCRQAVGGAAVGRTDDLFALGLNSLTAMRLLVELTRTFEVALPPNTLQICSSIAALAHRIGELQRAGTEPSAPTALGTESYDALVFGRDVLPALQQSCARFSGQLKGAPVVARFPVGPLQRRHIRRNLTHPQVFQLDLDEPFAERELRQAVVDFIAEQELLRCVIQRGEGGDEFVVHRATFALSLPTVDVSQYTQVGQSAAVADITAQVARELAATSYVDEVLFRVVLIKRGPRRFSVILQINHLISDHESGRILEHALLHHRHALPTSESLSYGHFLENFAEPSAQLVEQFTDSPLCRSVASAIDDVTAIVRRSGMSVPVSSPIAIDLDYPFPRQDLAQEHDNPVNFALYVFLVVASTVFDIEHLPVKIAFNRRQCGDCSYRNTIGEFHDNIILTLPKAGLSLAECHRRVAETFAFMDEHGYLLMSMKDSARLREVAGATPLSFNHLGDLGAAEDLRITAGLAPFPLTLFPSLSYSVENKALRLLLNNGLTPKHVERVRTTLSSLNLNASVKALTRPK